MWTVEQHITLIHEVTATPLTTNKGIVIAFPEGLKTQAPSSPFPEYQPTKLYWEVEAKLHALLTSSLYGSEEPAAHTGQFTLMEETLVPII
jgi:hypothetical protein